MATRLPARNGASPGSASGGAASATAIAPRPITRVTAMADHSPRGDARISASPCGLCDAMQCELKEVIPKLMVRRRPDVALKILWNDMAGDPATAYPILSPLF